MPTERQEADTLAAYDRLLVLDARDLHARLGRAALLRTRGDPARAIEDYRCALALAPARADIHCALGACLLDTGDAQAALAHLDQALALDPGVHEASFLRGAALLARHEFAAALACLQRYVPAQPQDARGWNNLGLAHKGLGQLEEALAAFCAAIERAPAFDLAHANCANALYRLGRFEEARRAYESALRIQPANPHTRWNLALCRLLLGDWPGAWIDYELRWFRRDAAIFAPRDFFHRPWWRGEVDPRGKVILLHAEQGLGDTLQFCRYARMLAGHGARVVLEVPPSLHALLARSLGPGIDTIARGQVLPAFDLHCPLLSLPLAFRTTLDTIPAIVPYLRASAGTTTAWRSRLGPKTRPRIGLAWSSGISDPARDIPLALLRPLDGGDYDLIGLQTQVHPADLAEQSTFVNLRSYASRIADFDDTAALVELCDIVVSVDTSVAHLAGAMGKPTWILLPFAPDWRWQIGRSDSPWYPSATLLRQVQRGRWESVVAELTLALSRSMRT